MGAGVAVGGTGVSVGRGVGVGVGGNGVSVGDAVKTGGDGVGAAVAVAPGSVAGGAGAGSGEVQDTTAKAMQRMIPVNSVGATRRFGASI